MFSAGIGRGFVALAMMAAAVVAMPDGARAEVQIQVYGGVNGNFESDVTVRRPGVVSETRSIEWDGKSFEMPPYWGVRGIYWFDSRPGWGMALEFTHAKAYADLGGAAGSVYEKLEFTDGNNIVTANLMYRWSPSQYYGIRPYAGFGIGVAVPHVEVTLAGDSGPRTFEYQLAGFAGQGFIGLEMPFGRNWSGFVEGKLSYTHINADLNGGGYVKTDIWSPHFAIGLAYRF